jgi:rhodanese-related sulfurtransferase
VKQAGRVNTTQANAPICLEEGQEMKAVYKTLTQAAAIVALATALSLGVNALRPDGLPLAGANTSAVSLDQGDGEISVKDAAMLFASGRAVFLDARSQFEYEQGHIQGALSLPPREFASQFQDIKPRLMSKEVIITYCDGERCPLSHALAEHLRGAGMKNVRVLKNGWTLWTTEKLPVEKGR